MSAKRYQWAAPGDVNAFFGLMLDNIADLSLGALVKAGSRKPYDHLVKILRDSDDDGRRWRAAEALGACDVARVDFRLDRHGKPRLLEINTLPGLNPAVSDLCIMARAEGMAYETLISEILHLGAARFNRLLPARIMPVRIAPQLPLPLAT